MGAGVGLRGFVELLIVRFSMVKVLVAVFHGKNYGKIFRFNLLIFIFGKRKKQKM